MILRKEKAIYNNLNGSQILDKHFTVSKKINKPIFKVEYKMQFKNNYHSKSNYVKGHQIVPLRKK